MIYVPILISEKLCSKNTLKLTIDMHDSINRHWEAKQKFWKFFIEVEHCHSWSILIEILSFWSFYFRMFQLNWLVEDGLVLNVPRTWFHVMLFKDICWFILEKSLFLVTTATTKPIVNLLSKNMSNISIKLLSFENTLQILKNTCVQFFTFKTLDWNWVSLGIWT